MPYSQKVIEIQAALDFKKVISTARTSLRRLSLSDFVNMRKLESNPLIMKFAPSRIPQTESQTQTRLEMQISKQPEREPFGIWVADCKSDSSFLGWFMLMPVTSQLLELGFMIVEDQWNKGFTTEIARELIQFVHRQSANHKIMAQTTLDNTASQQVLAKLSFVSTGRISVPEPIFGGEIELETFVLNSATANVT